MLGGELFLNIGVEGLAAFKGFFIYHGRGGGDAGGFGNNVFLLHRVFLHVDHLAGNGGDADQKKVGQVGKPEFGNHVHQMGRFVVLKVC
ncbi:MAG: hypothetical protein WD426_02225 [Anditalea sp.]